MSPLTTVSNNPLGNIFIQVAQTLVQCVCVCVYVLGAKEINPCARKSKYGSDSGEAETVARPFGLLMSLNQ